ncbi:hypothetical protein TrST_g4653 [Triparma strigata]|uniref:Uncharacterized protein n=1 Tax=Triparma strigata TaxID=1606541 RepID=A0A9W7DT32_9STRA|nr:hypothetical protein TrST_g4653 [Triparma strigata]
MSLKFSIRLPSPCPFILPVGNGHLLCVSANGGDGAALSIVSLTLRRVTKTYPLRGQVLGLARCEGEGEGENTAENTTPLILLSYRSTGLVQKLLLDDYSKPTSVELVDFKDDCFCETFASPSLKRSVFLCAAPTDSSYTIYDLRGDSREATSVPSHVEGSKTGMLTSLRVMRWGAVDTLIALGFESGHLCVERLDSATFEIRESSWHLPAAEEPILSLSSHCDGDGDGDSDGDGDGDGDGDDGGPIMLAAGYAGEEPGFNVIVMKVVEVEGSLSVETVGKHMTSKSEIARPGVNAVKCFQGGVVSAGWDGRVRVFFHGTDSDSDSGIHGEEEKKKKKKKDLILKGHKGSVRDVVEVLGGGIGSGNGIGFVSSGEDGKLNYWTSVL